MKLGIFYPGYRETGACVSSIFIANTRSALSAHGVELCLYSDSEASGKHWYGLAEDYGSLDCLIVLFDSCRGFTLSRHVAQLYPGVVIFFADNLFAGAYSELEELSTAKVLRERFSRENSTAPGMVELLADTFERRWNPRVFSRLLKIRDTLVSAGSNRFVPRKSSAQGSELFFPILSERVTSNSDGRSIVLICGDACSDYYTGTIEEIVQDRFIPVRLENSGRWYSPGREGVLADRSALMGLSATAAIAIDITVGGGYALGTVAALSVGVPVAGFSTSSFGDVIPNELIIVPGFGFDSTVRSVLNAVIDRPDKISATTEEQQSLVRQYCAPKSIVEQIIGILSDEQFFREQEKRRFMRTIRESQFAMEGEAIE